jgi:hypothetical protein
VNNGAFIALDGRLNCGYMNRLLECALAYQKLLNTEYRISIGRKNKVREFTLVFTPYHFQHLIGLHKLSDVQALRTSRERAFKSILRGGIAYGTISKSIDFPSIAPRLDCFHRLEEFLDGETVIFDYDSRKNPFSNIEASYLLQNEIDDRSVYLFIDKEGSDDKFYGKSFFPKDQQDFALHQPRWTLLHKTKTDKSSGETIVLYDRATNKPVVE